MKAKVGKLEIEGTPEECKTFLNNLEDVTIKTDSQQVSQDKNVQGSELYSNLNVPVGSKTKFYVTVDRLKMNERFLYYLFFTKNIWINSIIRAGDYNFIVSVDYDNERKVNSLIGNFKIRGVNFQVRRIFKSMRLIKAHKNEPTLSFLNEIILLASARIKGTDIKIVTRTKEAEVWKAALIKNWQKEIDHPEKFKQLGIVPEMDISPKGKLIFHLNKVGNYIITYFNTDISKYYFYKR